jgi:hypothetical protein
MKNPISFPNGICQPGQQPCPPHPALGYRPFPVYGDNPSAGFSPEYIAIRQYAIGQGYALPSLPQQLVQDQLLQDLIVAGIWPMLDVFYNFFTNGDANFAKINWKNPGTFQAVGTGHEPTFTINSGFKGNGSTMYLDTQFNPSVNLNIADASIGMDLTGWIQPLVAEYDMGNASIANTNNTILIAKYINGFSYYAIGGDTYSGVVNLGFPSGVGMWLVNKVTSVANQLSRNGIVVDVTSDAGSFANSNIFLLAVSKAGTPTYVGKSTMGMSLIGKSLFGLESQLYTAWSAYKANA